MSSARGLQGINSASNPCLSLQFCGNAGRDALAWSPSQEGMENYGKMGYPEVEVTHADHPVPLLALDRHRTIPSGALSKCSSGWVVTIPWDPRARGTSDQCPHVPMSRCPSVLVSPCVSMSPCPSVPMSPWCTAWGRGAEGECPELPTAAPQPSPGSVGSLGTSQAILTPCPSHILLPDLTSCLEQEHSCSSPCWIPAPFNPW